MEHLDVNEYKQNMFKQDIVREVHVYLFDTIEYIFDDQRALLTSQTINPFTESISDMAYILNTSAKPRMGII